MTEGGPKNPFSSQIRKVESGEDKEARAAEAAKAAEEAQREAEEKARLEELENKASARGMTVEEYETYLKNMDEMGSAIQNDKNHLDDPKHTIKNLN